MAKASIQYSYPVESINRKMTLRRNTASYTMRVGEGATRTSVDKRPSRYMGGGTRTVTLKNVGPVTTNYMFCRFFPRTSAYNSDELAQQRRFGFISAWVQASKKNLSIVAAMVASFNGENSVQGIYPTGLTFNHFVWLVRQEQYDNGVTSTTDPAYNQWPSA